MVGIFISGIVPLFLNVIQVNKSAQYHSAAYKLADNKLESLRSGSFDAVVAETSTSPDLPAGNSIVVSVSNVVDGSPQENIKRVDVVVNWQFKRNQSVHLESFLTRNGLKK